MDPKVVDEMLGHSNVTVASLSFFAAARRSASFTMRCWTRGHDVKEVCDAF